MENLSEDRIIQDRIEKLEKIRKLNIDPFPSRWENDRKHIAEVIDTFTQNENSDIKGKSSSISGRIAFAFFGLSSPISSQSGILS